MVIFFNWLDVFRHKHNENIFKMFIYDTDVKNNSSEKNLSVFRMKLEPYPWLQKRVWDGKEGTRMHRGNV